MRPPATTSAGVRVVPNRHLVLGWRDEVRRLEAEVSSCRAREREVIAGALLDGCSYSEVARVVGITRQSAHRRFRVVAGRD